MSALNLTSFRFNLFLAFFAVVVSTGLTYFFFGFYFSEYEGLNIALLSGSLTPGLPFRSVYFSGNLVISWFYSLFYQYIHGIEWISWFEYLWMFIANMLAMVALNAVLPKNFSALGKVVVMVMVSLLVFADHQIHLIYTRVAYLVCGVSLISMVVFFDDVSIIKKKWKWFVTINLFFALGTFIRNEAAIACFLLILPFAFIYLRKIKLMAMLFLFPLMMVGGQSLFFAVDIKNATDSEFHKQVEPDIEEQFIARGNLVPLSSMKTHRDTVIYRMAQEMTLSDPRIMTSAYLRSLILPEKFMFTDRRQWSRAGYELKDIFLEYWYLVLTVLLLSVALFVQFNFAEDKLAWLYYTAFVFSFWALTVAQTYVDKVNERSWLPYIGLFILCHILLLLKSFHIRFSRRLYPIIGICVLLFIIHVFHLKQASNKLKEDLIFQGHQLQAVKDIAANRVLMVNSSAFNFLFLSNKPFHLFDFSAFRKVYITDSYIMPFLPYYKRYLESECKCDIYAYPSFWKYLIAFQNDAVIVSKPHRLKVIRDYLFQVHGFSLAVNKLESTLLTKTQKDYNGESFDEMEVYEIEK